MKKVILSIAVFAAASLSMMAANDNNANKNCNGKARTECVKNKECKADRGDKGMKAFDGLNLSDAQKAKIEQLQSECKAKREKEMKAKGENKEQKEQLTAEQKQQRKADMKAKRMESKQNYLKGIQSILTPEQYTKFLENNFIAGGKSHGKDMKKGDRNKGHKGGMHARNGKGTKQGKNKNGQKGSKGSRQNSNSNATNA